MAKDTPVIGYSEGVAYTERALAWQPQTTSHKVSPPGTILIRQVENGWILTRSGKEYLILKKEEILHHIEDINA